MITVDSITCTQGQVVAVYMMYLDPGQADGCCWVELAASIKLDAMMVICGCCGGEQYLCISLSS